MNAHGIWLRVQPIVIGAICFAAIYGQVHAQTVTPDRANDTLPDIGTRKRGVDWPNFLGPTGDGKSSETGLITNWPPDGPPLVWSMPLGTSMAMPSIAKGRLFMFDRFRDKNRLTAFRAETGEELWRYEYPTDYTDFYEYADGPKCSPLIEGNRVYIFGPEGILSCVRAADGKLIWQVNTTEKYHVVQNLFGVGCAPVIDGDLLIAQIGGCTPESEGVFTGRVFGNGSGIVAFDKWTGQVKYEITKELASYAGPVLTMINGRRWCFVYTRGELVGFEPQSGKIDFEFPWRAKIVESVIAANPVVRGDEVFISESYDVNVGSVLLKVRPGSQPETLWTDSKRPRDKTFQGQYNTPIFVDGNLYGCSHRLTQNAELRCFEWSTGKVLWKEAGTRWTALLYVDGHFVSINEVGVVKLLKVNPRKYEVVREVSFRAPPKPDDPAGATREPLLRQPCYAAPILSHGLMYLRGKDRLICVEVIPEGK